MEQKIQIRKRQKMSPSDAKTLVEYCGKHPEIYTGVLISKNIQDDTKMILDKAGIQYVAGVGTDEHEIETYEASLRQTLGIRATMDTEIDKCSTDYQPETQSQVDTTEELEQPEKINRPRFNFNPVSKPKNQQDEMISGYVAECTDEFDDADDPDITSSYDPVHLLHSTIHELDALLGDDNEESVEEDASKEQTYHSDISRYNNRITKKMASKIVARVQSDKTLIIGIIAEDGLSKKANKILANEKRIAIVDTSTWFGPISYSKSQKLICNKIDKIYSELSTASIYKNDYSYKMLHDLFKLTAIALQDLIIYKECGPVVFDTSVRVLINSTIAVHSTMLENVYAHDKKIVANYFNIEVSDDEDITWDIEDKKYKIVTPNKNTTILNIQVRYLVKTKSKISHIIESASILL